MNITAEMVTYTTDESAIENVRRLWGGKEFMTEVDIADLQIGIVDRLCLLYIVTMQHDPTRNMVRKIVSDAVGCGMISCVYREWLYEEDCSLRRGAWLSLEDWRHNSAWFNKGDPEGHKRKSYAWFSCWHASSDEYPNMGGVLLNAAYSVSERALEDAGLKGPIKSDFDEKKRNNLFKAICDLTLEKYASWMVDFLSNVEQVVFTEKERLKDVV